MSPESLVEVSKQKKASSIKQWLTLDNRFVPPVFITLILLAGQLSYGILESYSKTLLAIGAAIAAELALGRFMTNKWPHLASAYISGISVGILLRAPGYWPYIVCSLLAITSKYVLRWNGRHLWNPSNFGICAMLFLASDAVATLSIQWGNNLAAMVVIWLLGSAIILRLRRFHICAVYVVSFLLLSLLRARITGDPWLSEVSPITGPEYQLFIFFMITDPKTTVRSKWGQSFVAFMVAVVEMFLRLDQSIYAPLYALFIVGPIAMLIEMWLNSRRVPMLDGATLQSTVAGSR
ncbi:RnfABCDGE type electron transport complex subunit D [Acidicapsa dinghuensis]|uniref:RnfABCDGE type electron transport complex subunit D n=1 Tax=Acidicapsa dinghuensis TaxID=2218256 RepID=A0ABW1EDV6_9BACT|nr:RnfABCDGE type electron transport complex subunit D [Acidicapsa dinghuensis]